MVDNFKTEVKRVNGYLKEVVTFFDSSGNPISHIMNPMMVELKPRDVLQLFVGSFLIASPLCLTEEIWNLSISLHTINVYALSILSIIVVTLFIYFNFYKGKLKGNVINFFKRVVATFMITFSCVVLILVLIDKFPIFDSPSVAIKRLMIISFPTIFGAVISDYIK